MQIRPWPLVLGENFDRVVAENRLTSEEKEALERVLNIRDGQVAEICSRFDLMTDLLLPGESPLTAMEVLLVQMARNRDEERATLFEPFLGQQRSDLLHRIFDELLDLLEGHPAKKDAQNIGQYL